jgi:hypothetical protein
MLRGLLAECGRVCKEGATMAILTRHSELIRTITQGSEGTRGAGGGQEGAGNTTVEVIWRVDEEHPVKLGALEGPAALLLTRV